MLDSICQRVITSCETLDTYSLMRRYKTGMKKASFAQKAKISDGIHGIAKQLSAVRF